MDDHQTGLDTLHIVLGNGYSSWAPNRTDNDDNPDYLLPDVGYYFTGDINATGTKVKEVGDDGKTGRGTANDGYIDNEGTTFYRWGGSPPSRQANKIMATNATVDADVVLSLPADSTVRVQSGNQIEIPLTITPSEGVLIAGFEFEVEFKVDELEFIDMKTDVLPGPWFTYVNLTRTCKWLAKSFFWWYRLFTK